MTKKISQLFDLTGKTVVVTGAAMGIGKAIAARLAEAGANVLITDINLEAAQETGEELRALNYKVNVTVADAGSVADAERVMKEAVEAFGDLDILVNNAGIYNFAPALDIDEKLWDKTLAINLKGVMFYSQAAAKTMLAKKHGGRIVNIASVDAFKPTGNLPHYDASKGGVVMLTKSLAVDWGPQGISVNAIAPGSINTPGAAACANYSQMSPEEIAALGEAFCAKIPVRRGGEPDDVARAVLFLTSEAANYITGVTLPVDGGILAT